MRQNPPPSLRPNCLLTRYPICFIHGIKNIFAAVDYWHGIPEYLASHGYGVYDFKGPWRGPHEARLKSFTKQIKNVLTKHPKIHVIAHSLGAIDMLDLLNLEELKGSFSSVTFVSPPFGGSPFADLGLIFGKKVFQSTNETLTTLAAKESIKRFVKPKDVLLGTIISRPKDFPLSKVLRIHHSLLTKYLKSKNMNLENDGLVSLESQRIAESLGVIFTEFPGDHIQVIGSRPWPEFEKTAHEMYLDHAIFLAEYDFKTAQ